MSCRAHGGDHERFSHYADRDKITEAMVTGTPVVALCGKVWVPSRDPKKYPVCPECKRLFELGPEGRMNEWRERSGPSPDNRPRLAAHNWGMA